MPNISLTTNVYAYIVSCMATLVAILTAIWAFVLQRRRAIELDVLEQRIPAAARYEHLQSLLAEAEAEWAAMKDQLAEAKAIIAERDHARKQLDELLERLRMLEADRQQLQKLTAELEDVQRRHAEEYERHKELRKELESAEFRVAKLQEEEQRLTPSVEGLRNQEKNLKIAVASLEAERAKLEQQVASWRAQAAEAKQEAERLKSSRDSLDKEVQTLWSSRENLSGEVADLKKQKSILTVEAGKQPDRLADLWQPVVNPARFSGNMPEDELVCLEKVGSYMRGLGLRFPDRVLKAFHTSLKVADISPLAVLAGISGTGKSELPRRYAEAMGMHFLNIAVQPRWDSPQDMFGFFNYMEGRYRATELARALVQMDPYYDEKGRGWGDYPGSYKNLSGEMLLVLLDEMNLARVEYYFSEFLSRLEIRRGVNCEDRLERRKAEIPLEVGGAAGIDSVLYLFTNTNVLFAGTMNEDETTQTLSDKVVDRANVLRFGKPSRLFCEQTSTTPAPSAKRMLYSTWQSWIRKDDRLQRAESEQVNRWIETLNGIMTDIRRPFAFRTHLAMRTYAANYPDDGNRVEAIRLAMADQIEQKILPKFRGLDPNDGVVSDALASLVGLVNDELKDEVLAEAISQMRAVGEHLISWQGVDRLKQENH